MDKQVLRVAECVRAEIDYMAVLQGSEHRGLEGYCAVASWTLYRCLEATAKYDNPWSFTLGEYDEIAHCWVSGNGFIIDITATQFDPSYPAVRVISTSSEEAAPCSVSAAGKSAWRHVEREWCTGDSYRGRPAVREGLYERALRAVTLQGVSVVPRGRGSSARSSNGQRPSARLPGRSPGCSR